MERIGAKDIMTASMNHSKKANGFFELAKENDDVRRHAEPAIYRS